MRVLEYSELDITGLTAPYKKVKQFLSERNFTAAQVKKIKNAGFYRAKLDHTNRLLFKIVRHEGQSYLLLLEIIRNHDYSNSRFLEGRSQIEEEDIEDSLDKLVVEDMPHLHKDNAKVHVLNKLVSFDDIQADIFSVQPPLIIVGSAGSGKTLLTLEKMKQLPGRILYVSQSSFLTENARALYYSFNYKSDQQEIDFLSYQELLESLEIPKGKPIQFKSFLQWAQKQPGKLLRDKNKLFEEFKGVMTGSLVDAPFLSRERYLELGVKQSIFLPEERADVYQLFERYLQYMKENNFYDENIVSFHHTKLATPQYDYVVIDEVQDLTNIQIHLILSLLNDSTHFVMCGDANQIVHPNFFSWSKVKSLFYEKQTQNPADIVRMLCRNYRNSRAVNEIANTILKIKQLRFGSVDRESHLLMETCSTLHGEVCMISSEERGLADLNQKTKLSTKYAVIVLTDDQKDEAKKHFDTPLIFSVREAKGLEYDNVILFQLIETERDRFREIAATINSADLKSNELSYGRAKDKSDKSLEIYKFYINALYVACTRAIQNIIIIEKNDDHALFDLLGLKFGQALTLAQTQSSLEDWQREAYRLEQQGKLDQAEAIRQNVLKIHTVPWTVYDTDGIQKLYHKIIVNQEPSSKEEKITLLEYALVYDHRDWVVTLAHIGVKAAHHYDKSLRVVDEKYFYSYRVKNTQPIFRDINRYGINFRNPFNHTPYLLAAKEGNISLLKELKSLGADIALMDNQGRTAYQIGLYRALSEKKFQTTFSDYCSLICPSHINVEYNNISQKIDNHLMEFFMLQVMMVLLTKKQHERYFLQAMFCTEDFIELFDSLPNAILIDRRKKRSYLSSILSKNEVNREDKYNRKLFLRVSHGYYAIHPELCIKINDEWKNVYELIGAEKLLTRIVDRPVWEAKVLECQNG